MFFFKYTLKYGYAVLTVYTTGRESSSNTSRRLTYAIALYRLRCLMCSARYDCCTITLLVCVPRTSVKKAICSVITNSISYSA